MHNFSTDIKLYSPITLCITRTRNIPQPPSVESLLASHLGDQSNPNNHFQILGKGGDEK